MTKLSELKTGEEGLIVKILGHGAFRKRVIEMGFVRGHEVKVLLNAPLRDPIKYKILDYELSLRRSEADLIEVVKKGDEVPHNEVRKPQTVEDEADAAFAASLLPGSAPVLGVRLPALRKLAASLVKSYGAAALSFPGDSYFEEVMLRGMMTGLLVKEPSDWPCVLSFLPSVSDWSVCDSFCSSFPAVKRSPEPFFPLVYALRNEKAPFTARFSLVMMLHRSSRTTSMTRISSSMLMIRSRPSISMELVSSSRWL